MKTAIFSVAAAMACITSALPATAQTIDADSIIFNEICYDPYGTDNKSMSEWVELYNNSGADIDLSGCVFDGHNADPVTLPADTILKAGNYLVLAGKKDNLVGILLQTLDPDIVVDLNYPTSSQFANGSGTLSLYAPDGVTLLASVTYDESAGFPVDSLEPSAKSTGRSIELNTSGLPSTDPAAYYSDGANWSVSADIYGSPGRSNSAANTTNVQVTASRAKEFPTSDDEVTISGTITSDGTGLLAAVFNSTIGNTTNAQAITLDESGNFSVNLGKIPSGTLVQYSIIVADVTNQYVGVFPTFPAAAFFVSDDPVTTNDVIINEILCDPIGGDNSANSEYLELFNRRETPVDLSFYQWGRYLYQGDGTTENPYKLDPYVRSIPKGTIIDGKGFLILAGDKALFLDGHPDVNPDIVINAAWLQSALGNSGSPAGQPIALAHANAVEWGGTLTQAFETVPFEIGTNNWPAPPAGGSMELKTPDLDRTVGANWALPVAPAIESPGEPNTMSAVSDWAIY